MLTFDYVVKLHDFECQHWASAVAHCQELIQREECRVYSQRTSPQEGYQQRYCFAFHDEHMATMFALRFL
jgi:hypothetical protein